MVIDHHRKGTRALRFIHVSLNLHRPAWIEHRLVRLPPAVGLPSHGRHANQYHRRRRDWSHVTSDCTTSYSRRETKKINVKIKNQIAGAKKKNSKPKLNPLASPPPKNLDVKNRCLQRHAQGTTKT